MKQFILVIAIGCLFLGCNEEDSDKTVTPDKYTVNNSDYITSITDTGVMWYCQEEGAWSISSTGLVKESIHGNPICDRKILYFNESLPASYHQDGLGVKVTGDIYKYHHKVHNDGSISYCREYDYFYIEIKQIKIIDEE